MNVEQEIRELRQRVDKAETRLAALEGSFEFVSRQLGDMQRFMHAKFDAIDARFDGVDGQLREVKADVAGLREDLPGIVTDAVRSGLRPG